MQRAELASGHEARQRISKLTHQYQCLLLQTPALQQHMTASSTLLTPQHYDDVLEERELMGFCGFPLCNVKPRRQLYCSNECARQSIMYRESLNQDPAYLRFTNDEDLILLEGDEKDGIISDMIEVSNDSEQKIQRPEEDSHLIENLLDFAQVHQMQFSVVSEEKNDGFLEEKEEEYEGEGENAHFLIDLDDVSATRQHMMGIMSPFAKVLKFASSIQHVSCGDKFEPFMHGHRLSTLMSIVNEKQYRIMRATDVNEEYWNMISRPSLENINNYVLRIPLPALSQNEWNLFVLAYLRHICTVFLDNRPDFVMLRPYLTKIGFDLHHLELLECAFPFLKK